MKKIITAALLLIATAGAASAQRAGEFDLGTSSGDITDYNRFSLSYENTSYHNNWDESEDNFGLNGIGLNLVHGFKLSSSIPMFLELGGNINYGFGTQKPYKYSDEKIVHRNFNIQVPLNFTYRYSLTDEFSIAPYIGLNFKFHALFDVRYEEDDYKSDWESYFDKDFWDPTFNRFQMGWQLGVNLQYSALTLGVQYGTDFIPAYSESFHDDDYSYTDKFSTSTVRVSLGITF